MSLLLALTAAAMSLQAPAPEAVLVVAVGRLRNSRGAVHACLSRDPRYFPDCRADPAALRQSVPAGTRELRFTGFQPGRYALTLFHDENNNQRLDTMLGIPREGFGFSRNPTIRFGAPRFEQVSIDLPTGFTRQSVRMQYLL